MPTSTHEELINSYLDHLSVEIEIDKVILYGSCARESQKTWSDIDLLIISSDFNGLTIKEIKSIIYKPIIEYIIPKISPIGLSLNKWESNKHSDFIEIVIKTGKIINR